MTVSLDTIKAPGTVAHAFDGDGNRIGRSGCLDCGARFEPITIKGVLQDECPFCEEKKILAELDRPASAILRPLESRGGQSRNALCDCGSGLKYKKCHGK